VLKVVYKKKALKAVGKMPKRIAGEFFNAFGKLAQSNEKGLDVKKLRDREAYRLRIGGYRAIYTIDDEQLILVVLDAGPRGGIYK